MTSELPTMASLLSRIAACKNRDEAAAVYAEAIKWAGDATGVNWPALNGAILERWSDSGLRTIKARAWKRLQA